MTAKAGGIAVAARALDDGNIALAQIATVHLQLPPIPAFAKGGGRTDETIALAALLHRSGILKITPELREALGAAAKRDVSDEPRIPQGQSGAGQWTTGAPSAGASPVTPAQATIPFEGPIPIPLRPLIRPRPLLPPAPPALDNPPIDLPDGATRDGIPQNPFPHRPECVEEWAAAKEFCLKMKAQKKLGRNSGFGSNIWQCMMGQVSEECGGNSSRA
jgi:hypothetical protein